MNREFESRESKIFKNALHDIAEKSIPDYEKPWQFVRERILKTEKTQKRNDALHARRKISMAMKPLFLIVALVIAILGMLFLPQGNALADQILKFFQISPSTRPLPTPFPTITRRPSPTLPMHQKTTPDSIMQNEEVTAATITPQSSSMVFRVDHPSQGASSGSDQTLPLDRLAEVAGFEAYTPAALPQGYSLRKSVYNEDLGNVVLFYSADYEGRSHLMIVLTETAGLTPFEVGMDADVEQVTVGEESGELVLGGWMNVDEETVQRWNNETPVCTVRWQAEEIYYTLQVVELREPIGESGTSITLIEEAISVAQSIMEMQNPPYIYPPTPDPSCLSLAEAEKLAGFDARMPAHLPDGVALSCVKFQYIFWPEIELRYQTQDKKSLSLIFFETPRNALPEGKITLGYPPEKIEKVMILNWPGEFVAGSWTSRFPNDWLPGTQTPTPVWNPDSSSHLSWGDENIWIIMNSYEGLGKEEMIRIAESLCSH